MHSLSVLPGKNPRFAPRRWKEHLMIEHTPENKEPPQSDNDGDTRRDRPQSDEAKEIKEKGEPDGGGNFA